jgi:peptidoglycan/LPS O-acetylase OafA/YrhL
MSQSRLLRKTCESLNLTEQAWSLLTLLFAAGFLVAAWQSMSESSDWLKHLGLAQLSVWVTLFIAAVVGLNQTRHLVFDDLPESRNAASAAIELFTTNTIQTVAS